MMQVELMVAKNQALLTEKAEFRRQAQLAEQTEQELARKSQVFQKTIKNLVSHLACLSCLHQRHASPCDDPCDPCDAYSAGHLPANCYSIIQ